MSLSCTLKRLMLSNIAWYFILQNMPNQNLHWHVTCAKQQPTIAKTSASLTSTLLQLSSILALCCKFIEFHGPRQIMTNQTKPYSSTPISLLHLQLYLKNHFMVIWGTKSTYIHSRKQHRTVHTIQHLWINQTKENIFSKVSSPTTSISSGIVFSILPQK